MSKISLERVLSLDVARGIAALCVVTYHWSHFYLAFGVETASPENYPLHWLLGFLHRNGWMGVEFFFILSGAIFFTKYGHIITKQDVGGWNFFVFRFSRLYPLHLATLVAVGALQLAMISAIGRNVIYPVDAGSFVLNLLFIQNWFLSAVSFNAPAWSLSIEALLYFVFFIVFRFTRPNVLVFVALAVAGLLLYAPNINPIGRGLWCFFLSGTLVWLFGLTPQPVHVRAKIYAATLFMLGMVIVETNWFALSPYVSRLAPRYVVLYVLYTGLMSGVVLSMLLSDRNLTRISIPLAWLGDISYSSYLLHFPLQLVFMLLTVAIYGTYTIEPFRHWWMVIIFFVMLIPISLASFRFLESPSKLWLRSRMMVAHDRLRQPRLSN